MRNLIDHEYKDGPEPILINGVKWDPYKWPKISGFQWGYFTPISGLISPYLITGVGTHLVLVVN